MNIADLEGPWSTVFDIGADTGAFAQAALAHWPGCTVHSFEPLRGVANLNSSRWHWHRVALADAQAQTTMFRCEFSPSSSLLEMAPLHKTAFPYTSLNEPVAVMTERLDAYDDLIDAPALLKLDVQGYELRVLLGAGAALDLFDAVVLEVSWQELYRGAPAPEVLADFLTDAGFMWRRRVDEMPHPETGEVLQSDELWVRA